MIFFFIFSLFIAFSFGYDEKIECDFYNQKYPNLTITKMSSGISSKLCDDVCINYLCAVNFTGESDAVKVYALGSGCTEDILTNCGHAAVGFTDTPLNIETLSIYTSSCATENGTKDCAFSLPDLINNKIKNNPNAPFGWHKRSDIHYDPEISATSFGYDAKVQCESYNQEYPDLTLTKVNAAPTNKSCDDICINYLCPVNFYAENNNKKVYAMGSGCIEDVRINCGNNELGFRPKSDLFFAKYVTASVCVGENGVKKCNATLPNYLKTFNQSAVNLEFGWGHIKDIQYKPDVERTTTTTTTTSTSTTTSSTTTSTKTTPPTTPTSTSTSTTTSRPATKSTSTTTESEESLLTTSSGEMIYALHAVFLASFFTIFFAS